MTPPATTMTADEPQTPVPTAAEAKAALRELDAVQSTITALTPGWTQTLIMNATAYGAGIFVAVALTGDSHIKRHPDRLAIGILAVVAGTCYLWLAERRARRLGISVVQPRRRRSGRRRLGANDSTAVYICVMIGLVSHDWVASAVALAILVCGDALISRLYATDHLRRFLPARFRPTAGPVSFYREFLGRDLWRVAGALVVVERARPGALAPHLDLTRDQVDDALETLNDLGYLTASGKKGDGRGQRVGLNGYGREAFRHQLDAYESTALAAAKA